MTDPTQAHAPAHDHADEAGHFALRTYLVGFALSVVLTAIPFWLVMHEIIDSRAAAMAVIVGLAAAQIIVHTVAFLHVNSRVQGGWTLVAYVFTAVLVLIIIAGSMWIMLHLNTNMMPGMPGGSMSQMP